MIQKSNQSKMVSNAIKLYSFPNSTDLCTGVIWLHPLCSQGGAHGVRDLEREMGAGSVCALSSQLWFIMCSTILFLVWYVLCSISFYLCMRSTSSNSVKLGKYWKLYQSCPKSNIRKSFNCNFFNCVATLINTSQSCENGSTGDVYIQSWSICGSMFFNVDRGETPTEICGVIRRTCRQCCLDISRICWWVWQLRE